MKIKKIIINLIPVFIILFIVGFFWIMWPQIQERIDSSPCDISKYDESVQGRCGE